MSNSAYTIISLVFISSTCYGQGFGSLGTVWKHCLLPDPESDHKLIQVYTEDSISFEGLECYILRFSDFATGAPAVDSIVVCNDDDRTYYVERDSLYLLYDFSLQAGDQYEIKFPSELDTLYQRFFPQESLYWNVHIDSVDSIEVDGVVLKRQYIHYLNEKRVSLIYLGDWAIERIGYETWLFPFLSVGYLEYNPYSELVEFVDHQLHILDTTSFCTITSLDNLSGYDPDITVYPNPCRESLQILANDLQIQYVVLRDTYGKALQTDQSSFIDLAMLPAGLYFLQISLNTGTVVKTVVKF